MTTTELYQLLVVRFGPPEYALFPECAAGTGYRAQRWADALALSLWPSRGLILHGFELKVSRQDWLRELRNPKKADDLAKYCDRWWLVVSDESIVASGELPETWGLLCPCKGKLVTKKEPDKLEAAPMARPFVAALLRRASEREQQLLSAEYRRGHEKGREEAPRVEAEDRDREVQSLRQAHKRLQDLVRQFEDDSGISITEGWQARKVCDAVKELASLDRFGRGVVGDLNTLEAACNSVLKQLDVLRGYLESQPEKADEQGKNS